MHATLKIASVLCTAGLFAGCATTGNDPKLQVAPSYKLTHGAETADAYHALGRYHHGAARYEEAAKAYEQAIALDRQHVDARNALGVLYAEIGRYVTAVAVLREAARLAPHNSRIQGNLGYACYLNGDYHDAAAALHEATRLDPENIHATNNLASVMDRLRTSEKPDAVPSSTAEHRSPSMVQEGDVETGFVPLPGPFQTVAATTARQVTVIGRIEQVNTGRTAVRQIAPNLYEVHAHGALPRHQTASQSPPVAPDAARQTAPAPPPARALRMEISNGNGITGMAKSVGELIGSGTLRVVRLTNQPAFDVQSSRLEYRTGYADMARALAETLGLRLTAIHQSDAPGAQHLRLVLGHDLRDLAALRGNIATARASALGGNADDTRS